MEKYLRQNKAITLIALVITIIILLILAGISIVALIGENGLISRSKLAKTEQEKAQAKEELQLKITELQLKIAGEESRESTLDDFNNLIAEDEELTFISVSYNTSSTETSQGELETIKVLYKDYIFTVDEQLVIIEVEENSDITNVDLNYEIKGVNNKDGKIIYDILIIVQSDKKVTKVECGEQILKTDAGVEKIAIDFEGEKDIEYTFKITTLNGKVVEKTIVIKCEVLDLEQLVDNAQDGDTIEIPEGTYILEPVNTSLSYMSGNTQSGINDKGKALTFAGKNEKTKLIFYGSSSTLRDGNAIQLANNNSVVRNLIFEFYPDKSTDNAQCNAIFSHSKGKIYNVYFKIQNDYITEYTYTNHSYLDILISNCTFYFKNTNLIQNCYGGGSIARYQNILTNYEPVSATEKTNILTKDFGGNIESTKTDLDVINNEVGVFYGEYAWE